jgi:hypothetical protein
MGAALLAGGAAYLLHCYARHVQDEPFFYTSSSDNAIGPGAGLLTIGIALLCVNWEPPRCTPTAKALNAMVIIIAGMGAYLLAGNSAYMVEYWLYFPCLKNKEPRPDVTAIGLGAGLFGAGVTSLILLGRSSPVNWKPPCWK